MIKKEMEQLEDILRNPKGKKKKQQQQEGKVVVWDTVEELQTFTEGLTRWQYSLSEAVKKLYSAHAAL